MKVLLTNLPDGTEVSNFDVDIVRWSTSSTKSSTKNVSSISIEFSDGYSNVSVSESSNWSLNWNKKKEKQIISQSHNVKLREKNTLTITKQHDDDENSRSQQLWQSIFFEHLKAILSV